MKLKVLLFMVIFLITTIKISAEDICGIVYSMTTVEPMENVSIFLLDKEIELKSNVNGDYCLNDIENALNDTIIFACKGYDTLKVAVKELQRRECKSIFLTQ